MTLHTIEHRLSRPTLARMRVRTLHPGDVALGVHGDRLETLLGSCVAIVLTDPRRTVGAMCHYVHSKVPASPACASTAYAAAALDAMYGLLLDHAIAPKMCEAYVYGGGNMFPELIEEGSVGDDNVHWAMDALAADGIRVLDHDLGGRVYRRLSWAVGHDAPRVTAVAV